jgi:hypothetical protein
VSRPQAQVEGFDYVAGVKVSKTPSEWRAAYPAPTYSRRVENGETFYSALVTPKDEPPSWRLRAEAYANIPEVRHE